jgi:hypothetical protein
MTTMRYPQPKYLSRWIGWYRASPSHPWKQLISALTETEAWDQLLDRAPAGGDKTVLREGTDPNTDRTPLERRRGPGRSLR